VSNAIFTGLIEFPEDKVVKSGNTALIGAKMLLFREEDYEKSIISRIRHVSLETYAGFQDIFIRKMNLDIKHSKED